MSEINTSDYSDEIQLFFQGKEYYENLGKGNIWVCHHVGFDTLTIEPIDGGQYEIAVRIATHDNGRVFWAGYWCDPLGFFHGINTGGH